MCLDHATQQRVKEIVSALFANGQSPLSRYGIDADKIARIEQRNPQLGKMGVPLTHPLDAVG